MLFKKANKSELPPENNAGDTQDNQSASLKGFRETLKDVLEDITMLEVNTIVVGNISTDKFDARKFYEDMTNTLSYRVDGQIEEVLKNRLAKLNEKYNAIKTKGKEGTEKERKEYAIEASDYEELRKKSIEYKKSVSEIEKISPSEREKFEKEQEYYRDVYRQFSKLDFSKKLDKDGRIVPDASIVRFLRKLWEAEQTIVHCDRIYAQTRFQLDGDLSNRFVGELFGIKDNKSDSKLEITANNARLILDIHNQAVENAESQWSKLINTAVDLITKLIPYRK
jgi:hypothetical protein